MLDMQSYHIQKLDDRRTSFKQIHLFDLSGWGSSITLQRLVCKSRGEKIRKTLFDHLNSKENDITIEQCKEKLSKDPLGRLLVDLEINKIDEMCQKKKDKN